MIHIWDKEQMTKFRMRFHEVLSSPALKSRFRKVHFTSYGYGYRLYLYNRFEMKSIITIEKL